MPCNNLPNVLAMQVLRPTILHYPPHYPPTAPRKPLGRRTECDSSTLDPFFHHVCCIQFFIALPCLLDLMGTHLLVLFEAERSSAPLPTVIILTSCLEAKSHSHLELKTISLGHSHFSKTRYQTNSAMFFVLKIHLRIYTDLLVVLEHF